VPDADREIPTDRVAEVLLELYRDAQRKIDALIEAAIIRGAAGTQRHYELQRAAIRAELAKLEAQSESLEGPLARSAYGAGVSAVDETLDLEKAFTGAQERAMEVLARNIAGDLKDARDQVGREADDIFRRVGLQAAARDIAIGRTRRETAEEIRRDLLEHGITAFTDKSGRRWSLSRYADMVARTTSREAVSRGTVDRLLEHGRDLVRITDHRGSCPICIPLEGKTYSLTGASPNYPKLPELPPFHPNCRHVVAPASVTFEEFERALGLAPEARSPEAELPPVATELDPEHRQITDRTEVRARQATVRAAGERALATIERVHTLGPPDPDRQRTSKVGIVTNSSMASLAQYEYGLLTELKISVNPRGKSQAELVQAVIHEVGHMLDSLEIQGSALKFATEEGNLDELLQVIRDNDTWRSLRDDHSIPLSVRARRYMTAPDEIFARAYAQWIALESGDPELKAAIERERAGPVPWTWTWEEFEAIAEAFDTLARRLGWR